MKDERKTRAQLVDELNELRARNKELEVLEEDHRQAEQSLRESEEHFRDLVDRSLDMVWRMNSEGVMTYLSPSMKRMSGYDPEELTGIPFEEFAALTYSRDSAEVAKDLLSKRLQGTLGEGDIVFELTYRRKDGTEWVGEVRSAPLLGSEGQILGVQGITRDITERKRAEVALRESLGRSQAVMDSLDALVYVADIDSYEILFVNKYGRENWGDKTGKLCWQSLQSGQTGPCDFCTNEKLLDPDGRPTGVYQWEFQNTVNGRWYDCRDQAIPWSDGRLVRMEIATNITERKKAENALRESEERYRLLAENATDIISMSDLEGRMTYVSPSVFHLRGYTPEEAMAQSFEERLTPASAVVARNAFAQTFKAEDMRPGDPPRIVTFEIESKCKDGSTVWVETKNSLMVDSAYQPIGVLSVGRDITERKKAEEALRESEERNRTYIDNSPYGIFIVDSSGRYLDVNKAAVRLTGFSRAELLRMSVGDIVAPRPEVQQLAREGFEQLLAEGHMAQELPIRRKDGSEFYISVNAVRLSDDRFMGFGIDITERKRSEEERLQLEAQVRQSQKLESLGVLAGGIAHDFNNLLTGVLGNADIVLANLSPVSPVRPRVETIMRVAERAAELSSQMLAYSGKGTLSVSVIDLNEVVNEMEYLLDASVFKKVALKYFLEDNLPSIEADVTQIRQIVMNLITNGSEAIGDDEGVVAIRTGIMKASREYLAATYIDDGLPDGMHVYLEVTDTGCGMDEETRKNVFDPFFTTKFTGRGLGLAATLGIVRGHHGAIEVESEPGQGTTFRVLFPALAQAAVSLEQEPKRAEEWHGSGTILLVDDEEAVRDVGKEMLDEIGFKVVTAENGRDALEVFQKHREDIVCVLLDLSMPRMGGEETFRELRRLDDTVRVVFFSGYSEVDVAERFAGQGIAGFVQKPFTRQDLITGIRLALDSHT